VGCGRYCWTFEVWWSGASSLLTSMIDLVLAGSEFYEADLELIKNRQTCGFWAMNVTFA